MMKTNIGTRKRIFTWLLTAILVLVTAAFPGVLAAGEADSAPTEQLMLLEALGIASADSYSPAAGLTKGEMAGYLYRLAGAPEPPADAESVVFSDVPAGSDNAGAISYLKIMGVLSGDDTGAYHPEQPVTGVQAVKATAALLGYGPLAENYGGYPGGWLRAANQNKLLRGLTATDQVITQADFFRLMYNALFAKSL
ncbi:MAG: S-layer homology domain-containing protein, partial [Clostridia bacterium]